MIDSSLPRPSARCLTREEAASYLGIGLTLLESLGVPTLTFGRRRVYDRVDLDAWLDDYKRRGRARKETLWPVQQGSIDAGTPGIGGSVPPSPTAVAYAKVLGLKVAKKPKPYSPKSV
jgi:hypothetical protein